MKVIINMISSSWSWNPKASKILEYCSNSFWWLDKRLKCHSLLALHTYKDRISENSQSQLNEKLHLWQALWQLTYAYVSAVTSRSTKWASFSNIVMLADDMLRLLAKNNNKVVSSYKEFACISKKLQSSLPVSVHADVPVFKVAFTMHVCMSILLYANQ